MANRKRNIQMKFYVTEEEKRLIDEKMAQLPTRRYGAYLRKMAIDGYIIQLDTTDIKRMNAALSAIGRNVNQIAKRVNAGGGTGWEAWTSVGETEADNYATIFYEEAARAFPEQRMRMDTTDGDPDKEAHFYLLRHTTCPAIITENFFMDTEADCRLILSEEGRKRVADMHVSALLRCIEYHRNK